MTSFDLYIFLSLQQEEGGIKEMENRRNCVHACNYYHCPCILLHNSILITSCKQQTIKHFFTWLEMVKRKEIDSHCHVCLLHSRAYIFNLFDNWEFYLGQILTFYKAKYLGQRKFQIANEIWCVELGLII